MASLNLLLLTWKPRSGQQGASSVSVQRERLSEKTGNAGCDSLNLGITKEAQECNPKRLHHIERWSNKLIVRLIGWAGNMTASGLQFQGILTE
jgi:hypothetical protein